MLDSERPGQRPRLDHLSVNSQKFGRLQGIQQVHQLRFSDPQQSRQVTCGTGTYRVQMVQKANMSITQA
jgi:hypothetical protein